MTMISSLCTVFSRHPQEAVSNLSLELLMGLSLFRCDSMSKLNVIPCLKLSSRRQCWRISLPSISSEQNFHINRLESSQTFSDQWPWVWIPQLKWQKWLTALHEGKGLVRRTLKHERECRGINRVPKKSSRDSFDDGEARRLKVRVYGRDRRDLSTLQRVDAPRDTFLTEREYQAYGLQGERRNLTISDNVDPRFPSHEAYYEEDRLSRRADEIRRETVTGHRDYVHASQRYLDDIDYRTYSRDTRPELSPPTAGRSIGSTHHFYPEDQYITYRHGPASLVPYAERLRREDIPSSSLHGYDRARAYGYETDRCTKDGGCSYWLTVSYLYC
ncbi:hypothetical protein MLD38_027770 [Melastoma candidum]|uniref:Uncharacterized protein n=1 Tax=Melastoma candidum TaxID=119954 RepID=A0ACB9P2T3_9MYRT|nr:hypothetical protein MLD38_027770 [Melastoma candidum]